MIGAIRSELLKLRERTYRFGVAGMAAFMAVAMLMSVGSADDAPSDRGPAGLILGRDQLAAPDGLGASLGNAATFLGIAILTLAAINAGGEYGLGTIRNLLVRHPRRWSLLAGKAITLAMYAAIAVALSAIVGVIIALTLAPGNHIDTGAWMTTTGWAATAAGTANLIVAVWGWAALGLLLAVATRSAPAAIGAGVAYALPGEILMVAFASDIAPWLPGQVLQAVARGGTPVLDHTAALVRALAWIAIAIAVAIVVFHTREVAD